MGWNDQNAFQFYSSPYSVKICGKVETEGEDETFGADGSKFLRILIYNFCPTELLKFI